MCAKDKGRRRISQTSQLAYIPSSSLVGVVGGCQMMKVSTALRIGGRVEVGVFFIEHEWSYWPVNGRGYSTVVVTRYFG